MNTGRIERLAEQWRTRADRLYSSEAADALRDCASELEDRLREWKREELSVAEAAKESHFAEKSLRRMVRDGRLPDSRPDGSREQIRIRRKNLPRKPGGERDKMSDAVEHHVEKITRSK